MQHEMSTSSHNAVSSSLPHKEIVNKVFGIPLIVKQICSYSLYSTNDLLRLRLLNRLFQEEATKQVLTRPAKYCIRLWKYSVEYERKETFVELKEFVELMKRRQEVLRLWPPFPFSSFTLNPDSDSGLIQSFSKMSGGQIRGLKFVEYGKVKVESIENVLRILSHSPRLVKIKFSDFDTTSLAALTPEQIARLPTTFHQLRDLKLGYEEVEVRDELSPLFEVLIRRAPGLERVRVPLLGSRDAPDMRILRLLLETHSRNLPLISYTYIRITPNSPTEWMELNFHFWEIKMRMVKSDATDVQVGNMKRRVETWIERQSVTLTSLVLRSDETLPPLALPPLPCLQRLEVRPNTIEAFDLTRYPSLHKVWLVCPPDDAGRISTGPMGLVQALNLDWPSRFTNPSWKQTFPNLTYLHFGFWECPRPSGLDPSDEDVESSIAFILTHFPALVRLDICLLNLRGKNRCLWNVLTGSAPRPAPNSPQLHTNSVPTFPSPEPLTGIYDIPSLGNMRALKKLKLEEIETQGTLDAIAYMTCAGLLGPLHKLELKIDDKLLPVESEQEDYRRRLARVHKEVKVEYPEW